MPIPSVCSSASVYCAICRREPQDRGGAIPMRVLRCLCFLASVLLASCSSHPTGTEPILLFDGTGASRGSVAALRSVLENNHLVYATVDSAELDRMDEAQLRRHRLLIMPGGDFVEMGNGLSKDTTRRIRDSVGQGLSYLG